jgi:hypothetical protein
MTNKKVWIDPPTGFNYGFPKVYDPSDEVSFAQWLVREGYPQTLITELGDHFYCRQWDYDDHGESE